MMTETENMPQQHLLSNTYKTNITAVSNSRDQTFVMLSIVSDSVGTKRKFLEDAVSRLTSDVGVVFE